MKLASFEYMLLFRVNALLETSPRIPWRCACLRTLDQETKTPQWKTCVSSVFNILNSGVNRLYIDNNFDPEVKKTVRRDGTKSFLACPCQTSLGKPNVERMRSWCTLSTSLIGDLLWFLFIITCCSTTASIQQYRTTKYYSTWLFWSPLVCWLSTLLYERKRISFS